MTNPLAQDLGGVVRLLEKATPGPWTVGQFGSVHRPKVEGSESSVGSAIVVGGSKSGMYDGYQENCEAIAASVNFLRANSAEIAGALRDAEMWRAILIDTAGNLRRMKDDEFQDCDHDRLDAVLERLDTAMQQGGGGGEAAA